MRPDSSKVSWLLLALLLPFLAVPPAQADFGDIIEAALRTKRLAQRLRDGGPVQENRVAWISPVLRFPQPGPYELYIQQASRRYGVDVGLIRAVIEVESAGNSQAVSPEGAIGLMQVMPATARELGIREPHRLFDPRINIHVGTQYLAWQLWSFNGNVQKALIAYNAGPGVVHRGGKLPAETQAYVPQVFARWQRYRFASR
jgi:soluble lytic murein transglycosylase-like protein